MGTTVVAVVVSVVLFPVSPEGKVAFTKAGILLLPLATLLLSRADFRC